MFPSGTASREEQIEANAVDSMDIYYAEGSDIPDIVVSRWANTEGLTVEENTETFPATLSLNEHYERFEKEGLPATVIYTGSKNINIKGLTDTAFYYVESLSFADGDDLVVVDFYNATEELALGDSGKVEGENNSFSFNVGKYTYPDSGPEVIADGYLHVGDETYNIRLDSGLNPFPSCGLNIFDSLHTK